MNLTVLISGRGSNMVALHKASERGDLSGRITHVISNSDCAAGLEYAKQHGITTSVLDHRRFDSRDEFDNALAALIEGQSPELVLLAGFMRRLGAEFTRQFEGRLLNIHPSLLPRHPGLHTHEKALEAGDRWHGCSVHFVTAVLDGGPVVARSHVRTAAADTPEALAGQVLRREHNLYWRVAELTLQGDIRWRDGHVEYCGTRLVYPLTL